MVVAWCGMGGKVITVIPLHLHPESLGHWALTLVPINGVGCHTWLLSQHIAHHPVNLHLFVSESVSEFGTV